MKRIYEKKLDNWLISTNRKPLILWGARQVGKTYLLTEWAKKNFSQYIYIDLKRDEKARDYFSTTCEPEKYIKYIEATYNIKPSENVLIIFDEIEMCKEVISSLKYFCQDYNRIPIICTGSLVRVRLRQKDDENFLFPVGKIDSINMFPMTFEEYLININPEMYERINTAYANKKPLEEYEHNLALELLYEYLSIGGMPEVVNTYKNTKSYVEVNKIIENIYLNYIDDMSQYNVSNEMILKTRKIYNNVFLELNKENNKNFKIGNIDKGKSNRDYMSAYEWLSLARLIHICKKIDGTVRVPLIESSNSVFRIYLSDAGLFNYQGKVKQTEFFVKNEQNSLSGVFYENYVAAEFVANDIPLYFWKGKSDSEFEFLLVKNNDIYPVDVKKSKGKLGSLDSYRKVNGKDAMAIKISANNYGYNKERNILTIPLYEVYLLAKEYS